MMGWDWCVAWCLGVSRCTFAELWIAFSSGFALFYYFRTGGPWYNRYWQMVQPGFLA